jgi:hypothetical protein
MFRAGCGLLLLLLALLCCASITLDGLSKVPDIQKTLEMVIVHGVNG